MSKPNLNAPSYSVEAKIEEYVENRIYNNNKSSTLILILIGIIICLSLIIIGLILKTPSPATIHSSAETPVQEKKEIVTKPIIHSKEKNIKNTPIENEVPIKVKTQVLAPIVIKKDKIKAVININKKQDNKEKEQIAKTIDNEFNIKISEALSAIEKNQFNMAKRNLLIAKKLKPEDPIILQINSRIDSKRKNIKINYLMAQAEQQEKNEQWFKALKTYNEIVKIDGNINTIIVKKQRTELYIKFNESLNKIISKPERLQSDKVLENSKKIIQSVKIEIKNKQKLIYPIEKTPLLKKKISNAEQIIKETSIPVELVIKSDKQTEVLIYKVGHMGKLTDKKIKIRPGHYTIVGTREGYRDVRKEIKITARDKSVVVIIQCRETI